LANFIALPSTCWISSCLLALHLLGKLLPACSSHPRWAPTCFLSFSSWDGSWASGFQESIHGCFSWLVWWWYGENYDVLLSTLVWPNGWYIPLAVHFSLAAGSTDCCGAASSTLSQMTELLVSSLCVCHTALVWFSPRTWCGGLLGTHMCCTRFKEQMLYLIIILNDANGKVFCPSLRVTYTNTNPFIVFFFLLF
jgi:hypothetical protein